MRVIGIDPSLTGTGIVVLEVENPRAQPKVLFAHAHALGKKNLTSGLMTTLEELDEFATTCGLYGDAPGVEMGDLITEVDFAVIEGYAFRSFRAVTNAELGTVFRHALGEAGLHYLSIPPLSLKKWAGIAQKTGNKSQPKSAMTKIVLKRWGYSAEDHNIADAYALARLGLAVYNRQNCEVITKPMREVVTKISAQATT